MQQITDRISDILLQRPTGFTLANRHYNIYPLTLGKSQLISRLLQKMEIDRASIDVSPTLALAKIVAEHKKECLRLIAYSLLEGKQCLNEEEVALTITSIEKDATAEDIVTLVSVILHKADVKDILQYYGIDKELEEYKRINAAKDEKGTLTFCGLSIYGTMISPLAEKYGWTLDYILWGISLDNIQLLLADAPKTIFLSEEERKRIHPKQAKDVIQADDPKNFDMIMNMNWD